MLMTIETSGWLVLSAAIFGVIVAVIIAMVLTRAITRPLAMMVSGLRKVAEGDLVPVTTRDEVGVMAETLNATVASLHSVMIDIRRAADQTASSGEQLSASAQNISIGEQTQASTVEEINAAVQDLSRWHFDGCRKCHLGKRVS